MYVNEIVKLKKMGEHFVKRKHNHNNCTICLDFMKICLAINESYHYNEHALNS